MSSSQPAVSSDVSSRIALHALLRNDSPAPTLRASSTAPRPNALHFGSLSLQQLPRSESEPVLSPPLPTRGKLGAALAHDSTASPPLQAHAGINANHAPCRDALAVQDLCICPRDPKIPRPRNAFILYRQHHASSIKAQNPQLGVPDISKLIGRLWRSQTQDVKAYWNNLADEEARRHKQQHPGYRYQPRRAGRKNDSGGPHTGSPPGGATTCDDCGKPTNLDTATAAAQHRASRPNTPSPSSTTETLPSHDMSTTAQMTRRPSKRNHPPPLNLDQSLSAAPESPSSKRRRLPGPGWAPGVPTPAYYPLTPWRHSFAASSTHSGPWYPPLHSATLPKPKGSFSRRPSPPSGRPDMVGPSVPGRRESMASGGVILPPLQLPRASPPPANAEGVAMRRISSLLSIAPPLNRADSPNSGVMIAIEGPAELTAAIVRSLAPVLSDTYRVHTAQSPATPPRASHASITDYLAFIQAEHAASAHHRAFLTTPSTPSSPKSPPPARPLLLIENYHLASTTAWAAAIPPGSNENYRDWNHWLWLATLWRGTLGPDITLLAASTPSDEIARLGAVEVREADKIVVVRVAGDELPEANVRRIAFEVREWCLRIAA